MDYRLIAWSRPTAGTITVMPDAEADLMWWRDGLWVAAFDTVTHSFTGSSGDVAHGVRLPPGALAAVLRDSAAAALNQRVELRELLDPPVVARLTRTVEAASDKTSAMRAVASAVLRDSRVDENTMRAAGALVAASARGARAADIARHLGWSPRGLHRFSVEQFGLAPSVLRQLLRFRRAHRLIAAGATPADAATVSGYSDQAHLTREFSRFAGVTPGRFIRAQSASPRGGES